MIDFTTLQGLTLPEGVVTQIEDASGRVIWAANIATDEPPAIFEVAKQTANSYSGETQYTDNEFILFDIYPKKGGTVNVTYGGLTKTVKDTSGAEEPNAIQVFFGRFNGVSDSVATPASGTLTIEGAYRGYGLGSFGGSSGKSSGTYANCVMRVVDFGNPVYIGGYTFRNCTNIVPTSLPSGLTSIELYTFYGCTNLRLTSLPSGLTSIGNSAFCKCSSLTSITIPSSVMSIGNSAFLGCLGLSSVVLNEGLKTIGDSAFHMPTKSSANIAMFKGAITFPSTLESIGRDAFRFDEYSGSGDYFYYTYLATAIMLPNTPPTLGEDAFGASGCYGGYQTDYMTFIVQKGCSEAYKAAESWSGYTYAIVEAS